MGGALPAVEDATAATRGRAVSVLPHRWAVVLCLDQGELGTRGDEGEPRHEATRVSLVLKATILSLVHKSIKVMNTTSSIDKVPAFIWRVFKGKYLVLLMPLLAMEMMASTCGSKP